MAFCSNCGLQVPDGTTFCPSCGTPIGAAIKPPVTATNPFDHTSDFASDDIANNKVNAMLLYLTSSFGLLVTLLGNSSLLSKIMDIFGWSFSSASDSVMRQLIAIICFGLPILLALLLSQSSPYIAFHYRQLIKITVVVLFLAIVKLVLDWTFIVLIVINIMYAIIIVVEIICFFRTAANKVKEAPIICSLKFIK